MVLVFCVYVGGGVHVCVFVCVFSKDISKNVVGMSGKTIQINLSCIFEYVRVCVYMSSHA